MIIGPYMFGDCDEEGRRVSAGEVKLDGLDSEE